MIRKTAVLLLCVALLSGCAGIGGSDVESLLRAPELSGESSAVKKVLSGYVGSSISMKYPTGGEDFLSPYLFGDWDGDGEQEAAALYTCEASGSNVCLAILEPTGSGGWRVSQTVEGLSGEVVDITTAHLLNADTLQILASYGSAQGDKYLVVYYYHDDTLQTVIQQVYTHKILAELTGSTDTEDLVLALPTETENGGVNLQLLTTVDGEFRSTQYLAVGAGNFSGCAALHAGESGDGGACLVVDGWATAAANSLASAIITYDAASGYLSTYNPQGIPSMYTMTMRYDPALLSRDVNGDGRIEIPTEAADGGEISENVKNRLKFLLWQDYTSDSSENSSFGIYDSEYRFFVPLPESLHGNVLLRGNQAGNGWLVCNAEGTNVYFELRIVDQAKAENTEEYTRIANFGSEQLQLRMGTAYYGLTKDDIINHTVFLS